ncbi:MAG: hypothetical protein ACLFVQ_09270, partial [Chitinispirillaceae bacterium]
PFSLFRFYQALRAAAWYTYAGDWLMDEKKYLHRRQYLLGPQYASGLADWNRMELGDGIMLTVHPDLDVTRVSDGENMLVLLGFILDPIYPEKRNGQILESILKESRRPEQLFDALDGMGGRYVLICRHGNSWRILNDAVGFRQVFFHVDSRKRLWCAGELSLLAENCALQVDPELRREFFSLPLFTSTQEFWYPSGLTLLKGAHRLLPNHYLDITTFRSVRYWPRRPIRGYPLDTSIEYACSVIKGLMEGAVSRFDTSLAVTAGLDTRIVLASCRDIREQLHYFTHTHPGLSGHGLDITIPASILNRYGLVHNLVPQMPVEEDREFLSIINRNVITPRISKVINAYTMYRYYEKLGREFVITNGLGGEVTRNFYYAPSIVKINGRYLAFLAGMRGSSLMNSVFEKWLESVRLRVDSRHHLLDLFYWEQRTGSWAAQSHNEYDIAFESFSPLNCRKLLEVLIGVKAYYRDPPRHRLHRELIARMWPELLSWEINPEPPLRRLLATLKRTPVHSAVRMMKFLPSALFSSAEK